MYQYSMNQWLFFFYLYSFLGWCFESTYVSIRKHKFVNRGFMRGPFLPLYGSGAIMMLLVSMPFQSNLVLVYIAGCIGATALEYVTGVVMETLFKIRYWDYSNQKLQFQGRICLSSSLAWGFFTVLMTKFLHKPVETFVFSIPDTIFSLITFLLTIIIVCDFSLSFKAALDLRDILLKLDKARDDMERLHKRLEVILTFAQQNYEIKKQEKKNKQEVYFDEIKSKVEKQLELLKAIKQDKSHEFTESIKDEIVELRTRFKLNLEARNKLVGIRDFYKKNMIRSNPGMSSKKFKNALEELKEIVEKKRETERKKNCKDIDDMD